jgi:hypothetical protein
VYSTIVSAIIGIVLKVAFGLKYSHVRFQALFIAVCEKKMEQLGLDPTPQRQNSLLPWARVEKLMLKNRYRLGTLEIMAVKSMVIDDDFIRTVDFRYSKYDLLARHGFAIVANHLSERDFQDEWSNSPYLRYVAGKKTFGYAWIFGWSVLAGSCLLAKMLELVIEGSPSQLETFQTGFFVNICMDLFVMQWVTFGWQDALCVGLKRMALPRDFPGRSRYAYRCALKEYDKQLRGALGSVEKLVEERLETPPNAFQHFKLDKTESKYIQNVDSPVIELLTLPAPRDLR